MKKKLQRNSDGKFLLSAEGDTWTSDKSLATQFKYGPLNEAKRVLFSKRYRYNELVEIDA